MTTPPRVIAARHRAILEAVKAGEPGNAALAVGEHFKGIDTRIERGVQSRTAG